MKYWNVKVDFRLENETIHCYVSSSNDNLDDIRRISDYVEKRIRDFVNEIEEQDGDRKDNGQH